MECADSTRGDKESKKRGTGVNNYAKRLTGSAHEDLRQELMSVRVCHTHFLWILARDFGWSMLDKDSVDVGTVAAFDNGGIVRDSDDVVRGVDLA